MFSFMRPRKLTFTFNTVTQPLTLAEAFAGRAGSVTLGDEAVRLWTPATGMAAGKKFSDMVCDTRFEPLSEVTYERFTEAAQNCNLPAHVVLFQGSDIEKIKQALAWFDYVLIPSFKLKNTEQDLQKRILGYLPQRPFRLREKQNF